MAAAGGDRLPRTGAVGYWMGSCRDPAHSWVEVEKMALVGFLAMDLEVGRRRDCFPEEEVAAAAAGKLVDHRSSREHICPPKHSKLFSRRCLGVVVGSLVENSRPFRITAVKCGCLAKVVSTRLSKVEVSSSVMCLKSFASALHSLGLSRNGSYTSLLIQGC